MTQLIGNLVLGSAVNHTIRVHTVSEFIECCLCRKVVKNKLNFRNHILNVHDIRGRDIVQSYGKIVEGYDEFQ